MLAAIVYFLKRSRATASQPAPQSADQPVTSVSVDYVAAAKPSHAAQLPNTAQMLLFALEFVSGFLFGSGLIVAGMVNPAKVHRPLNRENLLIHLQGRCILVCSSRSVCWITSLAIAVGRHAPQIATGSTLRWHLSWAELLQSLFQLSNTPSVARFPATTRPCNAFLLYRSLSLIDVFACVGGRTTSRRKRRSMRACGW